MYPNALVILLAVPALTWVGAQLLLFVYAPIRLRGKMASPVRPTWARVTAADLTPEARQVLAGLSADLAAAGFGPPVGRRSTESLLGATGAEMLAADPAGGRVVSLITVRTAGTRTFALSVRSFYPDDDTRVVTAASQSPQVYPSNPAVRAVNFPWVRDVPTLLEAHRRHLERTGYAARRATLPVVDPVETYGDAEWDREHQWWVRCGYRYVDAGRYQATWKGTFLTAWKLTPPIKGWRLRRRDARARRTWRDWGMDRWHPPAAVELDPLPVDAAAADAADGELRYESALTEGEVRREWSGPVLTVCCGGPTAGRVLLRQWGNLLSAALFVGLLCFTLGQLWASWQRLAVLPPDLRWELFGPAVRRQAVYVAVWLVILAWDGARLVRAVRLARGTATVTATPAGLGFADVPGRPRAGRVDRADVNGLTITLDRVGVGGRRYRLDLVPTDATRPRVPLMRSRSATSLKEARQSLLAAMGMADDGNPTDGESGD